MQIFVPSSSANLGSGYDTLAVAVNLRNRFEIELHKSRTSFEILSGIDSRLQPLCLDMAQAAARVFFHKTGLPPNEFTLRIENQIPIARGLASSATMRLAVLEGLNQLLKANVPSHRIVQWAAELEGSTDNATACYYGGLTASGIIQDCLVHYRFEIPADLDFIAVSPAAEVETDKARTVFTPMMPRPDAVYTLNHGVLLMAALAQGNYESIGDLLDDRIHQPQRQQNIPALKPLYDVIKAAREAGALGAYLSGSGSTMMAITQTQKETVAEAMRQVIARYDMASEVRFLNVDNQGLQIE